MNLGLYTCATAAKSALKEVLTQANKAGVSDLDSDIKLLLDDLQIPQLITNLRGAISQYLTYLPTQEAAPYKSLITPKERKNPIVSWFSSHKNQILPPLFVGIILLIISVIFGVGL